MLIVMRIQLRVVLNGGGGSLGAHAPGKFLMYLKGSRSATCGNHALTREFIIMVINGQAIAIMISGAYCIKL